MLRGFNWLAYWVGLPCLLFASVSQTEDITGRPLHLFGVLLVATIASGVVAWIVARLLRLPRAAIGTFVQAAFRGNLTLLALPVAIFAFGPAVVPVVALAIAPMMILYNIFAAFVLLASQEGADRTSKRAFVRQLMLNPLVLSILAGLLAGQAGLALPGFLDATIRTLGAVAIPVALLGIGGTLVLSPVRAHAIPAVVGSLIKVAVTPVVGLLLARALGYSGEDVRILGVLLAAPTAAASFLMAAQMKGDAALASSMVVLSTLMSAGSLSIVLLVL
jgi:predicted permease